MAATIRDVAKLAGVSPSTVSRVLNNKGVISEDTSRRIQKAMEELNYIPNEAARSVATGSPRTIALVIDVEDPGAYSNAFFNNTVFGIETTAHQNNYGLMITNGAEAFGGITSIERLILGKKVDGIIIPDSIVSRSFIEKLSDMQFPCVILGHNEALLVENSWVDINNVQAGALAVRHLYQQGYRRIAFLSDADDEEIFSHDRTAGYQRELSICGLSDSNGRITRCEPELEAGKQCVLSLLASNDPPDAVICSSDRQALGALRAAQQMDVSVPDELGILSFDDTAITELSDPSITSIDVNTYELGVQAAKILLEQIDDAQSGAKQILLPTKIIVRDSTLKSKGDRP